MKKEPMIISRVHHQSRAVHVVEEWSNIKFRQKPKNPHHIFGVG